jgi:hypothetical protein
LAVQSQTTFSTNCKFFMQLYQTATEIQLFTENNASPTERFASICQKICIFVFPQHFSTKCHKCVANYVTSKTWKFTLQISSSFRDVALLLEGHFCGCPPCIFIMTNNCCTTSYSSIHSSSSCKEPQKKQQMHRHSAAQVHCVHHLCYNNFLHS